MDDGSNDGGGDHGNEGGGYHGNDGGGDHSNDSGGEVLIPVMVDFSIKWRRRLKPVKKKGIGLL